MTRKAIMLMGTAVMLAGAVGLLGSSASAGRRGEGGVIFVRSQQLYYDTFAPVDPLVPHGRFQLLEMGPNGPETEFGPGDPGYLGGRWMEDFDGDGEFHYFLCPLLGPGREEL